MRASSPRRRASIVCSISSRMRARRYVGRDEHLPELVRPRVAGQHVEQVGDVVGQLGVGGEQPEVLVEARGLRVVVAGADVHVVPDAAPSRRTTSSAFACVLTPGRPWTTCAPASSSARAHSMLRALVEARLELHDADRLLARLGRLDQRRDERASRPTSRYTVILIASTSGSSTACSTNRSTLAANDS